MQNLLKKYTREELKTFCYLISGYIKGSLTKAEHRSLDDWITQNDDNMQVFEHLSDSKYLDQNLEWMLKIQEGD